MTESTTEDQATTDAPASDEAAEAAEGAEAAAVAASSETDEPAALEATPADNPVVSRFVLPLLLPVLSVFAVVLWALNVSRVFLAGDSTSALVIAIILTLGILGGASWLSATPRIRTSSLAMLMALVFFVVSAGGLLALGPSLESGEEAGSGGFVPPTGPAIATVEFVAQANLRYDPSTATVPPGVVEIDLVDGGGSHTLNFEDPKLAGFQLEVPAGQHAGKVDLAPGEYGFYCAIPGHRAAGMVGTLTVAEGAPAPGGAAPAAPAAGTPTTAAP
jgi:plastocyanin